jgi:hypothetical protein
MDESTDYRNTDAGPQVNECEHDAVTCADGHPMHWFDGDSQQERGFVHDNAADIVTCSELAS